MPERTSEHHMADRMMNNKLGNTTEITLSADEVRELIARRAYDLYQQRGTGLGDCLSDWLRAEAEVVTMLLAEPHETADTQKPNGQLVGRTVKPSRVIKAGNRSQLVGRLQKRKNALKSNPS